MDDKQRASASVVRNLDVIEAAIRHLVAVEKRLFGDHGLFDSECPISDGVWLGVTLTQIT